MKGRDRHARREVMVEDILTRCASHNAIHCICQPHYDKRAPALPQAARSRGKTPNTAATSSWTGRFVTRLCHTRWAQPAGRPRTGQFDCTGRTNGDVLGRAKGCFHAGVKKMKWKDTRRVGQLMALPPKGALGIRLIAMR